MKFGVACAVLYTLVSTCPAIGQNFKAIPEPPRAIEQQGSSLDNDASDPTLNYQVEQLKDIPDDLPLAELTRISKLPIGEASSQARSAKDAQLYRTTSPSVVLIATKTGLGSGSLIEASGEILTNFHVVNGYSDVGVLFKPTTEGKRPTKDDMVIGHVMKYDEIADLALIKVAYPPGWASVLRLGDSSEISVGLDVHAIGHPIGETWTYTKGIISQYRLGFEWQPKNGIKHTADVIQTQTPINPGNSGGPLISDSGTLLGVNSFSKTGEGLNYAVSVDDVKKFLARPGNRAAEAKSAPPPKAKCKSQLISRWRSKEEDATLTGYDLVCTGKIDAVFTHPDDLSKPIRLAMDRNHDGRFDVEFLGSRDKQSVWLLSFWDEKFAGRWTLVGYHDDGRLKPTRFESYETYRKRLALSLAIPDDDPDEER